MKTDKSTKLKRWQEKYQQCLALEFNNPKYFEVHHLLVLTFMLQTNGYSDQYFTTARDLLKGFLNNTVTPQEFISQFQYLRGNQNINNDSNNYESERFDWNLDILSLRTDNAEQYCQDVRLWANDVLKIIDEAKRI